MVVNRKGPAKLALLRFGEMAERFIAADLKSDGVYLAVAPVGSNPTLSAPPGPPRRAFFSCRSDLFRHQMPCQAANYTQILLILALSLSEMLLLQRGQVISFGHAQGFSDQTTSTLVVA